MRSDGFPVRCIEPAGAIYLTVLFDLKGRTTPEGKVLERTDEVTSYLLAKAGLAIVPFSAFGADPQSSWYRLSLGTCHEDQIPVLFERLRDTIGQLR
jgi:aspartate aminotransferase